MHGKNPYEVVCYLLPEFPINQGEVEYQEIFEFEANKENLHGVALKYIGEAYKSAKNVIDVNDPISGLIIVKGVFIRPYQKYWTKSNTTQTQAEIHHQLTFEIKDNRVRVTLNGMRISYPGTSASSLNEFIAEFEKRSIETDNEKEFKEKANLSIAINYVDSSMKAFLEGINSFFLKELEDDW
ncbi:DUF4468 domain-containing protein [Algoriphagus marincola]|uniref:DUF4468 domain-containing protein n=1 Tax=Algoriphagus marincola TaxID=264027 RepID=A0ABS7N6L4_9BACT|nr:DUF4468 domain-containing protein [Algoriphagus marincola]MBY5951606.1 DUF4468 domain-containing protein [Algoriphagus marincola]